MTTHHAPAAVSHPCMHGGCTTSAEVEVYTGRGRLEGLFCAPHAEQREQAAAAFAERQQSSRRTSPAAPKMPKMPEVGPVGRNVIANVERLCQDRGLSWRRLSAMLDRLGHPIPQLGLLRMRKAERRVDVDELTALSEVLGVTPDVLLAPPGEVDDGPEPPVLRDIGELAARIAALLEAAPDDAAALRGRVDRALRLVAIQVEELLAETGRAT